MLRNTKGMPFLLYSFFHLLLSIAFMVSRFKIHKVSHCSDSNVAYPASIACKMAKLFSFSEGRSQGGCTTDGPRCPGTSQEAPAMEQAL